MTHDSDSFQQRRARYRRMLTVYGRKSVLEALRDRKLACQTVHLAQTNRESGIIRDIRLLAEQRGLDVKFHTREALSRISRNGRQDQGVAADVICPEFRDLDDYLAHCSGHPRLLALDGITNPQNVGMIIRSAVAAGIDGLIYPDRGTSALGPLVIKASVGTVFKARLLRCETLIPALESCKRAGFHVYFLDGKSPTSLFDLPQEGPRIFVLGGETHGVSEGVQKLATSGLSIPMSSEVESLNVAVSAALVAYSGFLRG